MAVQDYERWKKALAMTESTNAAEAWGDHNAKHMALAAGRWQMHPVFVDTWWPDDYATNDSTSWDDLFEACLRNFFDSLQIDAINAVALAMWFHLHGGKGSGWDTAYADRFDMYYARA